MKFRSFICIIIFFIFSCVLIKAQPLDWPANYTVNEYNLNTSGDFNFENSLDKLGQLQLFYPAEIKKNPVRAPYKTPQPLKKKFFENVTLKNILNFSEELSELKDPDLATLFLFSSYLLEHDRELYKKIEAGINKYDKNDLSGKYTYLGEGFVDLGICSLLHVFSKNSRDKEIAQMGAESIIIAGLQTQWLKRFLGVPRPAWLFGEKKERHLGFSIRQDALPSGHTACAFALGTVLGEAYNLQWLTYPMAALAGLTRITEHAHWPSDVLIGGLIGHLAARKVLINHGWLKPFEPLTSWRNEKTYLEINSSLENYQDNNGNFSRSNKNPERFGHLMLSGQIGRKFSSGILAQLAYRYDRQTYNLTHINNSQGKSIAFRISGKAAPKLIFFSDLKFRDIQYLEVNALDNFLDYIDLYEHINYGIGAIYQLSPKFLAKIKYNSLNRLYRHFDGQASSAKFVAFGLSSSCQKSIPFQWEILYQRERNLASFTRFSYLANHWVGNFSQEIKNWGTLNCRVHQQSKFFSTTLTDSKICRKDTFNWGEISFSRDFKFNWSAQVKYILCRLNTNQLDSGYSKNMYSVSFTKNF